jgi:predicted Zn-dependent protease
MNDNQLAYVSGQVVFDREDLSNAKVPDRRDARAVMLHELGHLVGLDHTADRREIMFSEGQFNVIDYGPGDLRGLASLGTQQCFPDS